jgi:cell fate regulator YaaT (PSP1 superfamily)
LNLVRELAHRFHIRVEMRQIGVRDEAGILGGVGVCGRELCCSTWLKDLKPVSIKAAKQQGLMLNPAKLSGLCGRLRCCLNYELPGNGCGAGGCSGGNCGKGRA